MAKNYDVRWVEREGLDPNEYGVKDGKKAQVFIRGEWWDSVKPYDGSYGISSKIQVEDGTWKLNCAWLKANGYHGEDFLPNRSIKPRAVFVLQMQHAV